MSRHVRARGQFRVGRNHEGAAFWRIGVPREIAELVEGVPFTCHLTDEGILFRPVPPREQPPAWVPQNGNTPLSGDRGTDTPGLLEEALR